MQKLTLINCSLMNQHKDFSPPWELLEWQTEARDWVEQQLDRHSLNINGSVEQPHIMAWSTVMQIPTKQGFVYFKAGAPNQQFEPALMQLIYKYQPEVSLRVLAIDEQRGWMLLPEGGQTLRQASNEEVIQADWETMLRRFAELQIVLTPHTDEMLATGMPDYRPSVMPRFFDEIINRTDLLLIGEKDGLSKIEFATLLKKRSQLTELCNELESSNIPLSLDHGDLHDANVFSNNGGFTFFDWGDTSITHPFISLMVPLRVLGYKLGIDDEQHPDLEWARQAYLQAWTDYAPMKELTEIWDLALHVGKFQRSVTYFIIMKLLAADAVIGFREYLPAWLQEFLGHESAKS